MIRDKILTTIKNNFKAMDKYIIKYTLAKYQLIIKE